MTDDDVKLEPCPFCRDAAIRLVSIRDGMQVRCRGCGSCGTPTYHGAKGPGDTRQRAIAAWNRRPNSSSPDGRMREATIEECAKVADDEAPGWHDKNGNPCRRIAERIRSLSPTSEPVHNPDSPKPLAKVPE